MRAVIPKSRRRAIRKKVAALSGHAGFRHVGSLRPADFSGLDLMPDEAIERAGDAPFLIDLPLHHIRHYSTLALPCAREIGNPFVDTISLYLENDCVTYDRSPLKIHFDLVRPQTVAESMGLPQTTSLHPLLSLPPELSFRPWARPPYEYQAHLRERRQLIREENRERGADLDASHGHYAWGPVSPEKGALEFAALTRLAENMRRNGVKRFNGEDPLRVHILRSGGEMRAICHMGNHRLAAMTALGEESVLVWPHPTIIDRRDVEMWLGVVQGVFTREQALTVFDQFFNGRSIADIRREPASSGTEARVSPKR